MSDFKMQIVNGMSAKLLHVLSGEQLQEVTHALIGELMDYEVKPITRELTIYDDYNERLIKKYAGYMAIEGKAQRTIKEYTRIIRKLADFTGKNLTEVMSEDIMYYLGECKIDGISNVTMETRRLYISAFYRWLADEEIIAKNPCSRIRPIKCEKVIKKAFTSLDLINLRQAAKKADERAILEVLLSTGMRVSELCSLEREDINLPAKAITIRKGKGGKQRIVYIDEIAQHYLSICMNAAENVFISHRGVAGVEKMLKRLGCAAGVQNVHPHRFRRTFATSMSRKGMPIQDIQSLMGHTNIQTTMKYISLDKSIVEASYRRYA